MPYVFGFIQLKKKSELDSEGFLYINNTYESYDVTKTFKMGEITDTTGSIICPGEIVSIMDYEEFESNKENITHYSSVLNGKKIRIYILDNVVMISRECEIYPDQLMNEHEIKTQINFELLDKNICYYATIITDKNNNKHIILTYMTDILNPKLENIDLTHDLAFMNHLQIHTCENGSAMETFKTKMNNNQSNGLVFYKNDGQRFEFWTPMYSVIKSQERPYNMNPAEYYILLLNKYPLGKTYNLFFKDLHYDVDIYISHYPEDKYLFDRMEERLNIYANFNEEYLSLLSEDSDKIQKIKDLLCIDTEYEINPEEIVDILIKFNNNCDKKTYV
jgi:hypothetical protein